MIWAAIVGFLLASGGASPGVALATVFGMVVLKGLAEIAFPTSPITGAESPYALFIQNLRASGGVPAAPWIAYLVQMVFFDTMIGMAIYGGWLWLA